MDSEEIIQRIRELIKITNSTQNEFADKISIDRSNFSKHINGKLPISISLINKIVVALGVSKSWLVEGTGDIFYMQAVRNHSVTVSVPSSAFHSGQKRGAKVYDIDVTAGNIARGMQFATENLIGSIDVPFVNPNSNIVKVNGDSMQPIISGGDMIAIRPITNINLIFWGQIYVVVLEDYRMVKYLRKHSDPNMIILRSENKSYDDIEIKKSEIRDLFIVENIIRFDSRI